MAIDPLWVYFSAEEEGEVTTTQYCSQQPYLSLRFGTPGAATIGASQELAVRRITFTTTSHDQGFSDSESQYGGTYQASFTWFDACVLSPSGHERVPRRSIQYNVNASLEYKRHVNCWSLEDADDDLRHWMTSIRPGDTVQIVPRAHFPAWTNFVNAAKIELWASPSDWSVAAHTIISLVEKNDYSGYRPLMHDLREIRVVELQPGEAEQPIRLALKYTRLLERDCLRYDALSYCWGEAKDPQVLLLTVLDEHQPPTRIQTNRNLFLALRQLRHKNTPRTLWIDLLCINQMDMDERTRQVALMGEIFASAGAVCVWLGEPDTDIATDCRAIHGISQHYDKAVQSESGQAGAPTELPDPQDTHDIILDKTSRLFNTGFDRIFSLAWFERVWVLQEVWEASRVQVFCGPYQLQWEAIMQANRCLKLRGLLTRAVLPSIWTTLFSVKRDGMALTCERAPRLDILHILVSVLGMKATDARDKIFALLIFGKETHQIDQLPPEVKPDYGKEVTRVYADFTRWWIVHHASLRILSAVHTISGRSWVCKTGPSASTGGGFDLSQRPSWIMWHEGFGEWIQATLALHDQCAYRASSGRDIDTDLIQSTGMTRPMHLALKGIRISNIASIGPYPYYQALPASKSMQEAFVRLFDPSGTIGTWNSFKTRVSVGEPVDIGHHLKKGEEWKMHYLSHWDTFPPSNNDSLDGAPTWLACHGNCMFTDEDGRVGLCPSGSKVGDLVVVLYGGNVPYLLRPKPYEGDEGASDRQGHTRNEYHFVGECYAEGLMGGEACYSPGDLELEEVFVLV